jgi:ATP-dependent DNA ligase
MAATGFMRREGTAVRLFTRRGHGLDRPLSRHRCGRGQLRAKSFTLDGEAVVAGANGVVAFDALHRRHKASDAMLYASTFWSSAARISPRC